MTPRARRFYTWEVIVLVVVWLVGVVGVSLATGNVFVGLLVATRAWGVLAFVLLVLALLLAIFFGRRRD